MDSGIDTNGKVSEQERIEKIENQIGSSNKQISLTGRGHENEVIFESENEELEVIRVNKKSKKKKHKKHKENNTVQVSDLTEVDIISQVNDIVQNHQEMNNIVHNHLDLNQDEFETFEDEELDNMVLSGMPIIRGPEDVLPSMTREISKDSLAWELSEATLNTDLLDRSNNKTKVKENYNISSLDLTYSTEESDFDRSSRTSSTDSGNVYKSHKSSVNKHNSISDSEQNIYVEMCPESKAELSELVDGIKNLTKGSDNSEFNVHTKNLDCDNRTEEKTSSKFDQSSTNGAIGDHLQKKLTHICDIDSGKSAIDTDNIYTSDSSDIHEELSPYEQRDTSGKKSATSEMQDRVDKMINQSNTHLHKHMYEEEREDVDLDLDESEQNKLAPGEIL